MAEMKINTANYPYLEGLMRENPQQAREVMQTFIKLMDEAVQNEWHELPQLLTGGELSFNDLIKGILHGSLDLPDLNPEAYPALKEEVHPLSMIAVRKDYLSGGYRNYNWRNHFRLSPSSPVNQKTIEEIFRKLLRYYKYVKVDDLAHALMNNQIATFKSLHEAENLPFYPALRYQQRELGDLQVGNFLTDIGLFDCGELKEETDTCPACEVGELEGIGQYKGCLRCNAGFSKPE
jgi:hypothetical protein